MARTLGLPYPGGPSVANAAKTGDPKAYRLPVPHVEGKYNVSFSGLKTAVLNEVNKAQMKGEAVNVPDLAASFQERIAGILAEKLRPHRPPDTPALHRCRRQPAAVFRPGCPQCAPGSWRQGPVR